MTSDEMPGLTKDIATSCIHYPDNLHRTSLGFEPLCPGPEKESKSMTWINQYSSANMVKTDFSEAKNTAYTKSTVIIDGPQEACAVIQDGWRK